MGVRLEAFIPDPARSPFRLGVSVLDVGHLAVSETAQELVLGASTLGSRRLAPYVAPPIWYPIHAAALEIRTRRAHRNNLAATPDAGSLAAELRDPPDLLALGVIPGTSLRLVVPHGGVERVLWLGRLATIDEEWDEKSKTHPTRTTEIYATDAAAQLAAIPRYGAARVESPAARAQSYTTTAARYLPTRIAAPPLAPLAASGYETNLLAHLTLLATSTRCQLFVEDEIVGDEHGVRVWFDAQPSSRPAAATFSDEGAPSYLSLSRSSGTSQLTTVIEITNHRIGSDGSNLDEAHEVADPTLVATHGLHTARADTYVPTDAVEGVGRWLLARADTQVPTISKMTIRGDDSFIGTHPLKLGDVLAIRRLGHEYHVWITGIEHRIKPSIDTPGYTHQTTLTLNRYVRNT